MIRNLKLRNWRAYEELDLELGPGATFVVASNGIGKTSLIMGAVWGLLGEASRVRAAEEIRGDAQSATVEVMLRLPSGVDVVVTRSVTRKGKSTLIAKMPDKEITSQDELDGLLATEFGADPRVLAQLMFMIHGGALETFQGEFDLREHLAGVFGVTPLLEAAKAAKGTADRAASALRKMKTTQRSEKSERDKVVAEIRSVDDRLATTNQLHAQKVAAMNEAAELVRLGEQWSRFQLSIVERTRMLDALAEQASALLERPVTSETVVDVLTEVEQDLSDSLSGAESEAASARGKSELINEALSQLRGAGALCPTCLRPLSEHEAGRAEEEHTKQLGVLEAEMADAQERATRLGSALKVVREVLRQVRTLPVPQEPESGAPESDLAAAQGDFQRERDEVQTLDQQLAALAVSRDSLQRALNELEEDDLRARQLEALYRQEGIALAAHDAFQATGSAITTRYIQPLAQEVEGRWKRMFGVGGLTLSPEGHITRQVGSRTLDFESLSGGEKVWALLLTRLLVAGASTRAPFVWLDEPLEHLDPRLRKIVAGTLAKASSGAGLRQVIVTTYESELARQLMEDVPSASLIYVTTTE